MVIFFAGLFLSDAFSFFLFSRSAGRGMFRKGAFVFHAGNHENHQTKFENHPLSKSYKFQYFVESTETTRLNFCYVLFSQGKTPWVDLACADCPGSGFIQEPQIVPRN